jgi:hypothetical protein
MSLFQLSDVTIKAKEDRAMAFYLSNFNPKIVLGSKLNELQEKIGNPEESKVVNYVTDGAWSMHHLLTYLVDMCGPSKVYISTWRLSEEPLRVMAGLKSVGGIKELNLILSDRTESNNPQEKQLAESIADRIVYVKNHSKVTVIRGEKCTATIISTANYSTNRRIESGVIFYDWKISAFNKGWMENVLTGRKINEYDANS